MRILHVISSLNPRGGGPAEGLQRLGLEFERTGGAFVSVVTLDAPSEDWLQSYPLPVYPLGPSWGSYCWNPRLVPWLRRHAGEYDAVIINGIWQYTSFGTWQALRSASTPYFVFPHGMLDPWFKRTYPLKHLKKWLYWPWGEYRVLRDARAVIFTCEEERRLARESFWLYRCRERVVSYGTAGPKNDPEGQKAAFFKRFPEFRGRRLLLFLSRLHVKKGCDVLLRAFGRIAREATRAGGGADVAPSHLVLAGPCADPTYLKELQRLTTEVCPPDTVSFPGMLSGEVKWGAFRAAEAFVLPSHQENFGIAVAEALACGTPVLISNQVNIWREIKADGAGLVAHDTVEGIYEILMRYLALPAAEREAMGKAAADTFARRFEIRAAAASLLNVLDKLAARKERIPIIKAI